MVGFNRMVLLPTFSVAVSVFVVQVVQAPVPAKALAACTTAPLTSTSAGRLSAVPFAYLIPMVAVPAADAVTVNCAAAPTALLALQNPVPE